MGARLFIGVMSGTSCDGVDAALVRVDGVGVSMAATVLQLESVDYAPADQLALRSARLGKLEIGALAGISHAVADYYVRTVQKLLAESGTAAGEITAVAAHGQTLYHKPPLTYQAFDPALLACGTGIDVVSDFRRADCAVGGQGAPLVPFGDWLMFRADAPRVLMNIGGIANLTFLPTRGGAHGGLDEVWGFDVGPGNCLSDWVMREHGGGIDTGGRLAEKGRVLDDVAGVMLSDPFFAEPAPRSTDTPHMIALFRHALRLRPGATLESKLATANTIAATLIVEQIKHYAGQLRYMSRTSDDDDDAGSVAPEYYVAGGGVHNRHLMGLIEAHCSPLHPTDHLGVPAQAREAAAFALLAAAHVDRLPCHMPRVTGATRPVVLGSFTPAPHRI